MRKFLLSFMIAAFLMCAAMPVSAVHVKSATEKGISEIQLGGELWTKGWLLDETYASHKRHSMDSHPVQRQSDRTHSYWLTDFVLETAYVASEDLKAVWIIEIEDVMWGNDNSTTDAHGVAFNNGTGSGGAPGTNGANVLTNQLYIEFRVPSTPIFVTAGLQNFTLGHSVVLDNEAGGAKITLDVDPVDINLFTFKGAEGVTNVADDIDYYGLSANVGLGDAGSIGLFGIWGHTTDAGAATTMFGTYDVDGVIAADAARPAGAHSSLAFRSYDAWWAGLTADLAFDPVEIQLEVDVYQALWKNHNGRRDFKGSGWFAWLDTGVNMGDVAKIGLAGFIASGNNNDSYIDEDAKPNAVAGSNANTFDPDAYHSNNFTQIAQWDRTDGCILGWDNMFIRDGVAYNDSESAAKGPYAPMSANDNVLRNMMSAKLYASVTPVDWLTIGANGNAYWKVHDYRGSEDGESRYYGTEVDLDLTVQIYDQLAWTIEGGYMFTSEDAFDNDPQGRSNTWQNVTGKDSDNSPGDENDNWDVNHIWAVVSGITYNF